MHEAPILRAKQYDAPSVFLPENMLREARRQKGLTLSPVPDICVLDPDGDLVSPMRDTGRARRGLGWACYHTALDEVAHDGEIFGIVGSAVGAPFAVLVAEQLFASGCKFLISVTSAGQLEGLGQTPYFVLIDRAIREEGTSYHYLPPSRFADAEPKLVDPIMAALASAPFPVHRGTSWTTDAPFRETERAISAAREHGAVAVEMEAAGLYAFAKARGHAVLCFAHVTNQLAQAEMDFEKGDANGATATLDLLTATVRAWRGVSG